MHPIQEMYCMVKTKLKIFSKEITIKFRLYTLKKNIKSGKICLDSRMNMYYMHCCWYLF